MVGVVVVGMAARDAEDPLAEQIRKRVSNLPRCAPVSQAAGERLDEAVYPLGRLEQDGAAIGTRLLLLEGRDQGLLEQVREEDSLWYRVGCHAGASVVAQVVADTALVPHGGSCVCTQSHPVANFPG